MLQILWRGYVTSISGTDVLLSPETQNDPVADGNASGNAIASITVKAKTNPAPSAFWKSAATCGRFEVTIRSLA